MVILRAFLYSSRNAILILLFFAAMPNLSQVYSFIGNMVDPEKTRPVEIFIEKLKQLDPVTLRAVRKWFPKHLCSYLISGALNGTDVVSMKQGQSLATKISINIVEVALSL
jgi:hypothetical protein